MKLQPLTHIYSALRMPCMQYFLNSFGQNKEYHGLLQLFSVKFVFLDKAMNSGKNVKFRDFHYFLFEPTKNPKYGCKMIVQTMVQICAKFLSSRLIRNNDVIALMTSQHGNVT